MAGGVGEAYVRARRITSYASAWRPSPASASAQAPYTSRRRETEGDAVASADAASQLPTASSGRLSAPSARARFI